MKTLQPEKVLAWAKLTGVVVAVGGVAYLIYKAGDVKDKAVDHVNQSLGGQDGEISRTDLALLPVRPFINVWDKLNQEAREYALKNAYGGDL